MEPKEGDIQGGQPSVSKPESGFGKDEVLEVGSGGLLSAVGERRVGQKVGKT